MFILMLVASTALAQDRTVTGTVTAKEDGLPLPGVSVKVKGTTTGTQTSADGKFSIKLSGTNSVLVFTYIGYIPQELSSAGKSNMSVSLVSDAKQLGEVIVTALGIERQKREVGYAATTVSNEVITRGNAVNIANGLQGKVSGLNVTSVNNGVFENVKINLRGIRSLTGNNNPLLVLDGMPANISYLSSLNPNDIENATVLKGSSAAAIYGPDARNGVIVVTTKKGTKGDKPVISYSNATQFQDISFFPKFQNKFGSGGGGEYIPYENWSWGPAFDGSVKLIGDPLPDGSENLVTYSPNNSRKDFFNTGVTMQNDISFAAKDFYLSIQDAKITGIVPDDQNRRTGIRFNAAKEYGKFKASLNTNYIQQNYNVFDDGQMGAWNSANNVGLNDGLMNLIFNTPAHIPLNLYKDFENGPFAGYNTYFNHYGLNPYFALDNWRTLGVSEDLLTNIELNFKATDWLSINYRAGINNRTTTSRSTSKGEVPSAFGRTRGANLIPGTVSEGSSRSSRLTSEVFASIKKDLSKDFKFNALLGSYLRQSDARSTSVGATLVVPELFNISNRVGQLTGGSSESKSRLFSVYASAGLSYKGWANVEVTGRQDQTSVLSVDKNSFFYPGVSGSLVLSDALPALKNSKTLSYLKLRGAWNKTGNADISPYSLAATFSQASGFPYGTLPGFTANNTTYDPLLKPEFIESSEFGLETAFLDNRISFEATYFNQNNDNQIIPISVSSATGYTSSYVNAAAFINKGVEMDLKLTPLVKIRNVSIDLKANATYNESKITKIYEGLDELSIGGYTDASNFAIKGNPAFVIKATDYVRDPQGRVVVDAITGLPTANAVPTVFGQTAPKWILGLNPSVSYKGVTLAATFEYKGGHYAYHDIGQAMAWTGVSEATAANNREKFVFPNSVIQNPDGTFTPNTNVTINNVESFYIGVYRDVATNFITSAASWRLREIALNYDLPAKFLAKQKVIKGASIALTARNVALWLPKSNVYTDPDFNFSTGNTAGISNSQINPPTRLLGFNVNLTF